MSFKTILRNLLVFAAVVLTSPLWSCALFERFRGKSDGLFLSCGQFLSQLPGMPGDFLRRGFYWITLDSFSLDCQVGFGTWFSHPQCSVAARVYLGARCIIGLCEIAEDVLIGSNVDVISGRRQHRFECETLPVNEQGGTFTKVAIGKNTWIGNSSVVMADVGERCVVGAGSVVVKPIPPYSVAAGNPAEIKRSLRAAGDTGLD
jgi:virginiamycin A acetyltransferase